MEEINFHNFFKRYLGRLENNYDLIIINIYNKFSDLNLAIII